MKAAFLMLLMNGVLAAGEETVLAAEQRSHLLILKEVYLNGQGPFGMMIDTGAASCLLRPAVARRLGLRSIYAVEQETASGGKRVPVAILDEVRVGTASDRDVEVVVADVALSGVDGVLGQSWLVRHDYQLDYHVHRLVLNALAPGRGVRAPLRSSDGRPAISAEVNGRPQDLVVDSGASSLVLFGPSPPMHNAIVVTNNGSIQVGTTTSRITIGGVYTRLMTTVQVSAPPRSGLLPAASFGSVYISNRDGVVVLTP